MNSVCLFSRLAGVSLYQGDERPHIVVCKVRIFRLGLSCACVCSGWMWHDMQLIAADAASCCEVNVCAPPLCVDYYLAGD